MIFGKQYNSELDPAELNDNLCMYVENLPCCEFCPNIPAALKLNVNHLLIPSSSCFVNNHVDNLIVSPSFPQTFKTDIVDEFINNRGEEVLVFCDYGFGLDEECLTSQHLQYHSSNCLNIFSKKITFPLDNVICLIVTSSSKNHFVRELLIMLNVPTFIYDGTSILPVDPFPSFNKIMLTHQVLARKLASSSCLTFVVSPIISNLQLLNDLVMYLRSNCGIRASIAQMGALSLERIASFYNKADYVVLVGCPNFMLKSRDSSNRDFVPKLTMLPDLLLGLHFIESYNSLPHLSLNACFDAIQKNVSDMILHNASFEVSIPQKAPLTLNQQNMFRKILDGQDGYAATYS
eukprot:TRINITY_DN1445_c0_g1_i1.p1 TRINITY_DN1445_c0_g1~~TRINITY_DN1445_c0_g1_i1.p1  ORF type:complete len:348 (+),score=94.86 TRINITY_DN1445_c0_g1_i1:24-1067(+)